MQLNGIKFVAALMVTLKFLWWTQRANQKSDTCVDSPLASPFVCLFSFSSFFFFFFFFFFHNYTLLRPSFTFSVSFFISCLMEPDITLLRHNEKKKLKKSFSFIWIRICMFFQLPCLKRCACQSLIALPFRNLLT